MRVKYLIIGAGPTGLGAGWRLKELGENSFVLLERATHAGGLSASFTDAAGFTWDVGGHVIFSHYPYFDSLLDDLLDGAYLEHQRECWIRIAGGWVPYPFQNNIRHLPPELAWECVEGLLPGKRNGYTPANFRDWFEHVFGPGIARLFMEPYNFKVWATPPEAMDWSWIGERVSIVDHERVLKNLVLQRDDVSWGPNNTFKFPLTGGTGAIFGALARRLSEHIVYDTPADRIDPAARTLTTADGRRFEYETALFNTAPLDALVTAMLPDVPDTLRDAAKTLEHNGVYVGGVGIEGMREDSRCWMYFPEDDSPFYRVTNFHNYSPNNVAEPGRQRALMTETSFSTHKPEELTALMTRTEQGLEAVTLMEPGARVASRHEIVVDYGYPVPTLGRDAALADIQPWLQAQDIWSRGRFGGWKYEVGNMDHSVMQGVEWADRMLTGKDETTYRIPQN